MIGAKYFSWKFINDFSNEIIKLEMKNDQNSAY